MSSFHYSKDEFYRRLFIGMTIDRCYDLEYARFFSFSKCPPNFLRNFSYIKLAAAGFNFDSEQTVCKCYKCGVTWTDNNCNRDLMEVHRQISPTCHFACSRIREPTSANVNCPSIGIRRSPDVESQDEPRSEETFRSSLLLDTGYSSFALPMPIQEESNLQSFQQCSNAEESRNDFIYTDYNVRLSSFDNWPKTQTPADLASAGFFYTGTDDVVKCFSCGVGLRQWEPHDNPWMEHKRHSPECDFVERNMPVSIQEESNLQSFQQCSNAEESRNDFIYTDYNVRLSSFGNWPKTQTPADLASAGFFYTGTDDVVKCFSCGVCLGQWEPHDNPWMEHKKHSPECDFVERNMPNRWRDRKTYKLLTEQPLQNSEENGAIANPTDDVVTEFDNQSSRNFSTQIISDNNFDPYMESPAALAVLQTWSAKPNIKQLVKETLAALRYDKQCKPSGVQITGVILLLEDRDKKIQALKEHIQSLESDIDARNRSSLTKCGICLTEDRTMVCCPCGHFFCCEACSDRLQSNQNPRCPLCRHAVESFVKMFWA